MAIPAKNRQTYFACITIYKAGGLHMSEVINYFKQAGVTRCRATMRAHNLIDRGYVSMGDDNVMQLSEEIREYFDAQVDLDEALPACERTNNDLVLPQYRPEFKAWSGKVKLTYRGQEERSLHISGTSQEMFRGSRR